MFPCKKTTFVDGQAPRLTNEAWLKGCGDEYLGMRRLGGALNGRAS
jgi:hypothetical protein